MSENNLNNLNNLNKIRDKFAEAEIKLGMNQSFTSSIGISLLALALPFFFIPQWLLIGLVLYLVSIIFFLNLLRYLLFIQTSRNFNIEKRIEGFQKTM